MDNIFIASFITGLTAGGLSCFAVQGGLLSGSIARQVEIANATVQPGKHDKNNVSGKNLALSVILFLAAKLVSYTLLGFILGWLGSIFYLSPMLKGLTQIAIGVFLVGNALRMFNVHPFFRYFSFEPPSSWTRFIRRIAKGSDQYATPLFLGAMTILIPCGVTQASMAIAVGTGNPLAGAAVMFAFILGTSPTFFGVTVLANGLSKIFQKYFYPIVAIVILGLGIYTVDGGLNLIGVPFAPSAVINSVIVNEQTSPVESAIASTSSNDIAVIKINVINSGYTPNHLTAPAGKDIQLILSSNNVQSCSRAFVIPALDYHTLLPETGETTLTIPPQAAGSTLQFTCSMGMYNGTISFQ